MGQPIQLRLSGLSPRKEAEVDKDAPGLGECDGKLGTTAGHRKGFPVSRGELTPLLWQAELACKWAAV